MDIKKDVMKLSVTQCGRRTEICRVVLRFRSFIRGVKIAAAFKSISYLGFKFCIICSERETIISARLRFAHVKYFILYRMEF